jgi:hypothetical protein
MLAPLPSATRASRLEAPMHRLRIPALLLCGLFATVANAADEIHWTLTGPSSVTFDWRGQGATMRYGLSSAYGSTATGTTPSPVPLSSPGPFWETPLTGLTPNTNYHYSIDSGPDHTFRTMPPSTGTFTVYVEGDIGDALTYPRVAQVQALIAAGAPLFVLMVGDLTYANDHGQAACDQHYNDVMAWSQDAAYMPAWGNHEWDSSGDDLRNYKGRFGLPNPQTSPGSPAVSCCGEDWYWFDCGSARFIAYPEPFSGAWSDWNTKARAIMDAAQSNPQIRFIVTFGHRPAYSSGHHSGDSSLKSYLDALGAAHSKYVLNLNGHSHDYERTKPMSGVTHVTVGTGGSSLEEDGTCLWAGGCTPPAWCAFRAMHHGTLRLRITPTSISADAICGPAGDTGSNKNDMTCSPGSVFDSFVIGPETLVVASLKEGAQLAITAHPNPTHSTLNVQFSLASSTPARVDLVDLAGRTILSRDLGSPGPGRHELTLGSGGLPAAAGHYWLRLTQDGRRATSSVVFVR